MSQLMISRVDTVGPAKPATAPMRIWELPTIGGPDIDPKHQGLIMKMPTVKRTPPICRNSHVALVRIHSKPALYQPQTPLKEP